MVKKLAKIILKYPLGLANYIALYPYYKYSQKDEVKVDEMIEERNKKVLVLAPHVDDETIGLGATLIKHIKNNDDVSCIYITDGAGSLTDKTWEEVSTDRKKEAKKIQEAIGINEVYFLDEPDGSVIGDEILGNKILQIIKKENPKIIYTPFFIDGHNDHVETTKALVNALEKWNGNFSNIFMYEINCPIVPNLINSVSLMDNDLYKKKEHLLEIFESQMVMAFDGFMLLNRMKSLVSKDGYGAEVFVKSNVEQLSEINKYLINKDFSYCNFRQLSNRYNLLLGFIQGYSYKKDLSNEIRNILASR